MVSISIKKRIKSLEDILSYIPGKIILLEEVSKDLYKQYDYNFKENGKTYTENEIIKLQNENNNLLLISIEKEAKNERNRQETEKVIRGFKQCNESPGNHVK